MFSFYDPCNNVCISKGTIIDYLNLFVKFESYPLNDYTMSTKHCIDKGNVQVDVEFSY